MGFGLCKSCNINRLIAKRRPKIKDKPRGIHEVASLKSGLMVLGVPTLSDRRDELVM